jgi:diaminopimelate decarboxylase
MENPAWKGNKLRLSSFYGKPVLILSEATLVRLLAAVQRQASPNQKVLKKYAIQALSNINSL